MSACLNALSVCYVTSWLDICFKKHWTGILDKVSRCALFIIFWQQSILHCSSANRSMLSGVKRAASVFYSVWDRLSSTLSSPLWSVFVANLDIMASAKYIFIFPFNAMPHAVYSINQVLSGYCLATQALSPLSPASTFYEYTHKQVSAASTHILIHATFVYD